MAMPESRKRKLEEYEMQLFGFHSRAVNATMKNIVYEGIHGTIEKMCETIKKTYKLDSENIEILKTNQKQLERAYCKGAVPHVKAIEDIVNKCIAVPSNVLLEEDKYQRIQYSDLEYENMKQELEHLQQRATKATLLNAMLAEELQVLEQLPISEDNVNKLHNIVENGLKCPDTNDKMCQLVEDYKQFSTNVFGETSTTQKLRYNTVNGLKCKDFDFNSL